jgi:hypothetical protein
MSMKSFQANMSGQVTDGFVTASPITSLPSLKAMLHSAASRTSLSKYSAKSSGVDPALAACSTELHQASRPTRRVANCFARNMVSSRIKSQNASHQLSRLA